MQCDMERNKWKNISLIVSDFDGVMTDNRVLVDETGKESVYVSRADGQAVHMLHNLGIKLVIMSTETNGVVGKRGEKLGVECVQSIKDKALCLKQYCESENVFLENVAYIGNDVNDYAAMKMAGVKIVPADAYIEVKQIADYITTVNGGYGVIREVAGIIQKERES